MLKLNDDLLLDSYQRALKLNLNPDFLQILSIEIQRRKLTANLKSHKSHGQKQHQKSIFIEDESTNIQSERLSSP